MFHHPAFAKLTKLEKMYRGKLEVRNYWPMQHRNLFPILLPPSGILPVRIGRLREILVATMLSILMYSDLLAADHQVAEVNIHATRRSKYRCLFAFNCRRRWGRDRRIGVAISLALSWTRVAVKRTIRRQIINTRTLLPEGRGEGVD